MVVQFKNNWIKNISDTKSATAQSNFCCGQNLFSNQLFANWIMCSPITHNNNLITTASSFVTENLSEVELWKMDANMSVNIPANNNKTTTFNRG